MWDAHWIGLLNPWVSNPFELHRALTKSTGRVAAGALFFWGGEEHFSTMRHSRLFIFLMLTRISTTAWAQAGESELLPDLNLLQARVVELWSLITQGQKLKAISYVEPGRQEFFLDYNWRPLRGFALSEIRLSNQHGEAFVTVRAKAVSSGFSGGLEWPVEQTWIFRDGTWFFQAEESRAKELFRGRSSPGPVAASSKERKKIERKLRKFRIAASLFNSVRWTREKLSGERSPITMAARFQSP